MAAAAVLLVACGGGGGGGGSSPSAPTATLSAAPATVNSGESSTLTWSSSNATACTASGGWSGAVAASGTQSTGILTASTTYTLVCTGAGGTSTPTSTAVTVSAPLPTVTLTASPTTVNSGAETTLSWNSTNATSCTAGGGWKGTLATSGSQVSTPLTMATTFTLTCTGAGDTSAPASASVGVTSSAVAPVPTATLTANPLSIAGGTAATLTWTSTNATACMAGGGWSGTLAASGTKSTAALAVNTMYTLTCTGPGGTSPAATATVNVIPTATLTALPVTVAGGMASTLTWASTNATACAGTGSWTQSLSPSGSQSTGPVLTNSTFDLTCSGLGGTSAVVSATVNVVPTATLTANPAVIVSGGTSMLTWSSSNATACTASGGWSGPLASAGNKTTTAQSATVTYSLTCTGAGGSSAVASATVAVATGSLSPSHAELTISQTQQFTAASSPTTWAVDGVTNGNAGVGAITSAGLYTAGTTPGTHTIVATSGAVTQSAVASVTDLAGVYTYHNNSSRTGANTQEYALTTSTVNTTSFGKLTSCPVDGAIYGQPLWVANVVVGGVQHNAVFVATQHDSVYAFDADASACTLLWHANLLDAAHGVTSSEEAVPSNLVGIGSGDIQPEVGVTGTPVIDPATGNLYVVAKSIDVATLTNFATRLHALDITTGNERSGAPAVVMGTYPGTGDGGSTVTFVTKQELQRAGLALVNGTVYIAFTSHEDAAPWYGWMMAYSFNSSGNLVQTFITNVAPNAQRSGIWMSGGAPAVDSNNNIYALTGNGTFDVANTSGPTNDYGDSLIQLNAHLGITSYFTPSDQATDASGDVDFGAGGATLLADLPAGNTVTHALIAGGKDGYIYILNRDLLGGLGDSAAVQRFSLQSRLFATGAMWNNNYFVAGGQGPMRAYALSTSTGVPQLAQRSDSPSANSFGFSGVTPSVSASATQNGIVWGLDTSLYCTHQAPGCGPVVLWAYDAANMLNPLWHSNTVAADAAGYAIKFTLPTVANGHVYVGTRGNSNPPATPTVPGELDIYGLKP